MSKISLALLPVLISIMGPAWAGHQSTAELEGAKIHVEAVSRGAEYVDVMMDIDLGRGWKTYYKKVLQNDENLKISPKTKGVKVAKSWPAPEDLESYGIAFQGYSDEVSVPIRFWIDAAQNLDDLAFTTTIYTCSNICIMDEFETILDLSALP